MPDLIVFATLSPIMFVLLFRFVFGGAINVPGDVSYAEFLLPGIFAQTVSSGHDHRCSLADDLQKGLIDRFRSLPMAPSAVLVGRTVADLGRTRCPSWSWRSPACSSAGGSTRRSGEAAGGFLVLLGFAYAMSWLMAQVGLLVRTPEVVNNASFIVIFPITFVANTFVPWRPSRRAAPFAEWNPVSSVVQAARELFGNSPVAAPDVWSLQHPVLTRRSGGSRSWRSSCRCRCARTSTERLSR